MMTENMAEQVSSGTEAKAFMPDWQECL